MKKFIIAAVFAGAVATPAFASEVEESCKAYAAAHNGDASGCSCLAEAAESDTSLAEALIAIKEPADLESIDDATREAIGACYPAAE